MTRNDSLSKNAPFGDVIDHAIETYGALPVLLRAVRALVRPNRPPPILYADELPDWLQRDVGIDLRKTPRSGPSTYL